MNKEMFFDEVVEAVKNEIPDELKKYIEVNIREVIKNNDVKLHGLYYKFPDLATTPTIYLEDFIKDYNDGMSIPEIAYKIVCIIGDAMYKVPKELESYSFKYDYIKENLIMLMFEEGRNKERLNSLLYKPIEHGFVLVPHIIVAKDEKSLMQMPITKQMAKIFNYDIDKLLEKAMINSMIKDDPLLYDMANMVLGGNSNNNIHINSCNELLQNKSFMYILSNKENMYGAGVLFYPGVKEKIALILGGSYYVLPSSIHELIIVPYNDSLSLVEFKNTVREVNNTVVASNEILSDRIFMYDKNKDELIEL